MSSRVSLQVTNHTKYPRESESFIFFRLRMREHELTNTCSLPLSPLSAHLEPLVTPIPSSPDIGEAHNKIADMEIRLKSFFLLADEATVIEVFQNPLSQCYRGSGSDEAISAWLPSLNIKVSWLNKTITRGVGRHQNTHRLNQIWRKVLSIYCSDVRIISLYTFLLHCFKCSYFRHYIGF